MRVKASKQVSLDLLESETKRSPASLPQTTRAQLPPLGLRLSRVDWTEVMRKHGEHSSSVDLDSVPSSFYCQNAVEEGKTALGQLYYKEPESSLSPKPGRKRRKLRPVSLTASYEEQPDSAFQANGVTEAIDTLELKVIQIKQTGGGLAALEEEYRALEEGREIVLQRLSTSQKGPVEALKRLLGHYSQLLSSSLSGYKQTSAAFKLQRERLDPPHLPAAVPSAYQFDLVDQRERQVQARLKLEALERYIDADSEAYERLKTAVLGLLETSSSGTAEYLQKLYTEMSRTRTLPDNLPLQYPNLSLSDWESELKHRFREIQRITAKKVLSFFERKAVVSNISVQTDFEYIDLEKYSQIRQKVALSEANIKELMVKVRDLEGEVELKQRVTLRLHSEIEKERNSREVLAKDNTRLREEFEFLLKTHTSNLKELEEVTKELKEKRKTVKSLKSEVAELKGQLEQKKYVIEWFETNHNSGFEQVKEVRKELRVLYKQYFQPKLLSSAVAGPQTRRRSIGQSVTSVNLQGGKQRKRAKSLVVQKRSEEETLGLGSEARLQPVPSKGDSKGSKGLLGRRKVDVSRGAETGEEEEKLSETAEEQMQEQAEDAGNEGSPAEDSEESQFLPAKTEKKGKAKHKQASKQQSGLEAEESEGETVIQRPHKKAKNTAFKAAKGREKAADLSQAEKQPRDSVETETYRNSAASRVSREEDSAEEDSSQAERHRRASQPAEEKSKSTLKANKKTGKSKRIAQPSKPSLQPPSPLCASRASGPPSLSATPVSLEARDSLDAYSGFDLEANDKVCMTEADLVWPSVRLNSISTQYDYLRPEVVSEAEEDNAVVGADGVKYYMWPLNPNQLYGLSGDVFYHTVMRAFQAAPKIPLNKTGEPHQTPYFMDDTLSGARLTGEMRLQPTKPRLVEHTAACGKDCKHLKARVIKGKKEPLLPLARQDIKYVPKA